MNEQAKKTFLDASRFRIVLVLLLFVVALAGAAGLFYGYGVVRNFAHDVSAAKSAEAASKETLSGLTTLESQLRASNDVLQRLDQFYVSAELPQFQAIDVVRRHAARFELPVESITFVAANPVQPASTPNAAPSTQAPAPATTATTGTKSVSIVLTVSGTISYEQLTGFLYSVEQSLPYMKVSGVSVSSAENGRLTVEPITIQVLTR